MLKLPGEMRWSICESDRPKGNDLALLQERQKALLTFDPTTVKSRRAAIGRLFLRFPFGDKAGDDEITCYAQDIAPFPGWAIAAGLADIIGSVNRKVPTRIPSSPEIRAAVEAKVRPCRQEAAAIGELLSAKPVPDSAVVPPVEKRREMAAAAREGMRLAILDAEPTFEANPRLPNSLGASKAPLDHDVPFKASNSLRRRMGLPVDGDAAEART